MMQKILPAIAHHVGVGNHQSLYYLMQLPWLISALQDHHLQQTLEHLGYRSINLVVDKMGIF